MLSREFLLCLNLGLWLIISSLLIIEHVLELLLWVQHQVVTNVPEVLLMVELLRLYLFEYEVLVQSKVLFSELTCQI